MIQLNDVSKRFGDTTALYPTRLTIESAMTTVLIGPSGCGKSTILRLMNGLLEPTSGGVEFEGQRVSRNNVLALRRRMGYVIQDGGLFPHLTASQNVALMAKHLAIADDETGERLSELCELTRFPEDALSRYPVELSGGQRQRVSLMRALVLNPDVLLLDEPLGALDPVVRASLQTELKEIFQNLGKTVVLVTHDMAEAAYLGDQIVVLKEGRIIQAGTLDDLRDRPSDQFISDFISAQRSLVQL
ncbi:MAG: ATP-binding cassette domain-containing protein [Candidatus Poribacteria bacterium]|nr:ATP-binding cassette domain-containing protein [Candidatus Poribacteria bacterium]MDE0504590.1 ATP-binding cassette domain-containing protein [Candidatus Poribacteria bacterium]